jgi:DNA polymerase III subunit alpha
MSNYVCYHLHTEQSLLDSCTNYKLYVDRAKELGQSAICFTEHGNIYTWIEKKMYCDKQGIKYIHGVEAYLTKVLVDDDGNKIRDNYHTILIAKNYEGVKEINGLCYLATTKDHFYYKPRLSFDEFLNISDNVIKISACLASPLNKMRIGEIDIDERILMAYDYYEIQPHINSDDQKEYNLWLIKTANKYHKPLIAGTDTHSLNQYKAECRTILQLAKKIEFANEDEFDLTYKSYDELVDMFKQQGVVDERIYLDAINNTNVMADSVESFALDTSLKYPIIYGENDEETLWNVLWTKLDDKEKTGVINPDEHQKYVDRINEEMRVLKKIGMTGFMLFMSEMISWCWENNIPVGFCRGSVGGSMVAYISDIIDVNPFTWGTMFARFANEYRSEVGDIDVDISPDQRYLVYDYIINRFGKEKTAYILASGTLNDKGCIDEIGRALSFRDENSIYTLEKVKEIKQQYAVNPDLVKHDYPDLFYFFDGLNGTIVSQSMHPAGIVASPINLIENYGCFIANDGKQVMYINMEEVHETGLVKYDILGLRNIQIIRDTCNLAGIKYPKSHEINWNDNAVWEDMVKSPVGIFQFESKFAYDCLKKMSPHAINDMSLTNAALRPSGESYRDRLFNKEVNHNPSKQIDDLLAENYGWLCFQEDVIKFLQDICGLSGSDADNVRRAIGRKQVDRLQEALPQILEGYCKKSDKPKEIAEEEAKVFLQIIEDSSNYMFGYNHSTGYSMIGYLCAYLRYYYPIQFCTALLNNANNDDDLINGTALIKLLKIKLRSPKFRYSRSYYFCDAENNTIYKGLNSIKHMSADAAEDLYSMKNMQFDNFIDVLYAIQDLPHKPDSRQLDILIKIGYFEEFGKQKALLKGVEIFNKYSKCATIKLEKWIEEGHNIAQLEPYAEKMTEKMARGIDNKELILSILRTSKMPKTTVYDICRWQIELLGYTDITNSKANLYDYLVLDVKKTKFGTAYIKIYNTCYGVEREYRCNKKFWEKHPINVGDAIQVVLEEKDKVKKNENNEWVKTGEKITEIKCWKRIDNDTLIC